MGVLRCVACEGVIALAVCAVCERVRLATADVSRNGILSDLERRAMCFVGLRGVGLSGGFMTTLGSGAGGFGMSTLGGDTKGLTFR